MATRRKRSNSLARKPLPSAPSAESERDCLGAVAPKGPCCGQHVRGGTPLMSELLIAQHIVKRFGGLVAVNNVDFTIEDRSIVSLIGPNGAGKTTFFNILAGLYTPTSGSITFRGQSIVGRKPHTITRLGIARTFQNIRLFATMSALDNVLVGMHTRLNATAFDAVLRLPHTVRE